jgi:PAS domain S-box-containing protein
MNEMVPSPAGCDTPACFIESPEGECKRANEALRDSEERFRMIADSCPSMMWATSAEGVFNFSNKVCCDFFGMTHGELQAPKRPPLVHPDDAPGFLAAFDRAVGGRATFRMEARFRRADGEWRLLGVFAEPMFSSSGEYLGHIGLCADITERKRAGDALRESEQRHRQIVNSSNEGIWQIDKDYLTIDVNARMASMLGYERSEMLGRPLEYFLFEDELREHARRLEARRKGVAEQYECRWRHKDGRSVWTMVSATPVMDANNLFCGVLGMITDISERKQAEEALIISERRHRTLFESAGDAIFLILDGIFIDCNEMTLQMYGCTREQIIGHSPIDFSPPLQPDGRCSPEAAMEKINLALSVKTPVRFEWQHCRADRTPFDADVSLNQLDLGGKVYLMAIVKDISARKCAERELEQHRAHLEELVGARTEELTIASGMLHALIDNIPDCMYVKDLESRFVMANSRLAYVVGAKSPDELLGKTDFDFFPRELASAFYEDEQNVIRSGQPLYNREEQSFDGAGNSTHVLTTKVPVRDSEGRIIGIAGLGRDITARKEMEDALHNERNMLRALIDHMPDIIFVKDVEGRFMVANSYIARIAGVGTPEDLLGKTDFDFFPRELARAFYKDDQTVMRTNQPIYNREEKLIDAAGNTLDLLTSKVPLCNSDGRVIGLAGVGRDITERKNMEKALRNERSILRSLIDNIPDFMYVKDSKCRFVLANSAVASLMGAKTPEEMLGKTDFDFYPQELAGVFYEDEQNLIRSGQPLYNHEEMSPDSAGNEVHVLTTKVLLRDSKGQVTGIAGIGRNITERKKMEDKLREAERKYRGIFDNAVFGIFQTTPDGRTLSVNPAMNRIYGYDSQDEMIASVADIARQVYVDSQRREEFKALMEKNGAVQNFEFESLRKDGSKFWISMSAVAIRENGVVARYEGMCEDITARKKIENELFEAEQQYRGIFDNAIMGIFQSTPDDRVLSVNQAMARIYGYDSPEEMMASVADIARQAYVNPKRREEFKSLMEKNGAVRNFEFEALRKDGVKSWIAMSAVAIRENGVVARYEGMIQDITERKQLQDQLLQAQKLESVGQLAAGIAHEINTPTQYIGDNVRFLKDAFQDIKKLLANYERLLSAANDNTLSRQTIQDVAAAVKLADTGYLLDEIPKAIDQTLEGITRVSTIVGAMKEFSHPDTKEKIPLDLNRAINSTITVARNEWKYVADLETEFDPSLPLISCLPGEFNQVILNLIVNAAHAIADVVKKGGPEKGKITVQTKNCAEWVEIRIQDSGTGIPKKVQSRIFDPFFTTKEIGKGTGQGLAIARSVIVDKHGGSIHFETEEGKGTTFIIRLPHSGKALSAQAVAA